MNQTTTLDRDPIDPAVLEFAVNSWLAGPTDEDDIALEAVLLDQGVIRPDEVVHEFAQHAAGVHVVLDDGTEFILRESDGSVHAVR